MKRTCIPTNKFETVTILDVIEAATKVFFSILLILSAYLMSEQSYKEGFICLLFSSIYFVALNAANLKMPKALIWVTILGLSLKGFLGI
jgi:hypothetical protein